MTVVRKKSLRLDLIPITITLTVGLPWWLSRERIHLQCRRPGFYAWVGKIPWRRAWQPLQYSYPENPHGFSPEETGGLESLGSQRVGHDWATKHSTPTVGSDSHWGRLLSGPLGQQADAAQDSQRTQRTLLLKSGSQRNPVTEKTRSPLSSCFTQRPATTGFKGKKA